MSLAQVWLDYLAEAEFPSEPLRGPEPRSQRKEAKLKGMQAAAQDAKRRAKLQYSIEKLKAKRAKEMVNYSRTIERINMKLRRMEQEVGAAPSGTYGSLAGRGQSTLRIAGARPSLETPARPGQQLNLAYA